MIKYSTAIYQINRLKSSNNRDFFHKSLYLIELWLTTNEYSITWKIDGKSGSKSSVAWKIDGKSKSKSFGKIDGKSKSFDKIWWHLGVKSQSSVAWKIDGKSKTKS